VSVLVPPGWVALIDQTRKASEEWVAGIVDSAREALDGGVADTDVIGVVGLNLRDVKPSILAGTLATLIVREAQRQRGAS